MFMCNDTYEPPDFLFQMFITYSMYTIVTITKVKRVAEKKELYLKIASTFLIAVLNLILGKL